MVRSSYNGEDVKDYSAAGLYSSYESMNNDYLNEIIKLVWESKWNPMAYYSRLEHGIDHEKIRPTVIVQDYVDADYTFTLYTKDPEKDDSLLIEMNTKKSIDPYIIRYNRKDDTVNVESIARYGRKIKLDENQKIIHADPINDPVKKDEKEWMPLLKKICHAALEVEQEFKAPQDIEGGIKFEDGKPQIYFWQTRDIN